MMDYLDIKVDSSEQQFEEARFKSLLSNLKYILIGKNNELLSFDKIKKDFGLYKQRYLGLQTVDVDNIVGSLGRYSDFDKFFLPKKDHLQKRWAKIHNLLLRDIILPPVKLYKVGDIYFVFDGHHRVSVSKRMGVKYVDAEVTEFLTDVPFTTDMNAEEIFLNGEKEKFLNITGLKKSRPDIRIRVTATGEYDFLLGQINKLMVQLNENRKVDSKIMSFEEAAQIWYDNIYLPAIETIKNYGILEKFPNRTKTDLYVWINEHKRFLSLKYGRDIVIKFAAKDFLLRFAKSPIRRFKLKIINIKYKLLNRFFRGNTS
jgi:hypothetical protein